MENRTYRYMTEDSLYPFGYGLTYSNVELSDLKVDNITSDLDNVNVSITIKNIGNYNIEEVVQCYVKDLESKYAVRNHSLVGFKRVSLQRGESKRVNIIIDKKSFEIVDNNGYRYVDSNKFNLFIGICQPDSRSIELTKIVPLKCEVSIK